MLSVMGNLKHFMLAFSQQSERTYSEDTPEHNVLQPLLHSTAINSCYATTWGTFPKND